MYNQELRATGLELTQFTLLMALNLTGETPQGDLGKLLALDTTTLTGMLRLFDEAWMDRGDSGGRPAAEASATHSCWPKEIGAILAPLGTRADTIAERFRRTGLHPNGAR